MSLTPDLPTLSSEPDRLHEPIAIIGIGCRFPGGVTDLDSFWELLRNGVDAIREVPADRFDLNQFYDSAPTTPGKVASRQGGFLNDKLDQFDAAFFGISPREATMMDPQQRLLLETSLEAFEDAGLPLEIIRESRTGVFIGMWTNEYEDRIYHASTDVDLYVTTGGGRYAASGRLSYIFDLQGPSLTIDTACSSALVAVHLACQSLRNGESEMALAGATNLILEPHISIGYSRSKMLSPDARCKFGDASANGYVRSEGVGVLVLKPLSRALADNDQIHAVILGSATNNDGHSSGLLVAPSGQGQAEMLRAAYHDAGIAPASVGYIEAHGTGTPVGDPVELEALNDVLQEGRTAGQTCPVGSVKTNIGHAEAASGMAGLIKAILCLKHHAIPASLHYNNPNPRIPWNQMVLRMQNTFGEWPENGLPRIAGVNSFGVTGTNAHVVLQEAPPVQPSVTIMQPPSNIILPLSARSPEALQAVGRRYAAALASSDIDLTDLLYTASRRRSHHAHRLVASASDKANLVTILNSYAQGDISEHLTTGQAAETSRKIAFVFPGQGGQWLGMGRQLYQTEAAFRDTIGRCEAAINRYSGWSLVEQLFAGPEQSRMEEIDVAQPMIFAIEVALAETWRAWGVFPDAVVGHSMGEPAAAYISGALSLEDAVRVECARSRLMKRISGQGAMAVVELNITQAQAALVGYEDKLSIAVSNGPRSTVISGDTAALEILTVRLQAEGVFVRPVKVDVAAHSPQMDALRPELVAEVAGVQPHTPNLPIYSTVTGDLVDFPLNAEYWGRNLRQPVLFASAVEKLSAAGYSIFIECGPHPVLLGAISQSASGDERITIPSMRRNENEHQMLVNGLAQVHCHGGVVDWQRLYPAGRVIRLPGYPWQRERFWAKEAELDAARTARPSARLLDTAFETPLQPGMRFWQTALSLERFAYLADHIVKGTVLLPAAAFLEFALEAISGLDAPHAIEQFDLSQALPIQPGKNVILQMALSPDNTFEIVSRSEGQTEWLQHIRGKLRPAQPAAEQPAMQQTGAEQQPGSVHVAAMRARGLEYGSAFQAVEHFQRMDGEMLAALKLPAQVPTGDHIIHPTLLDASFQLLIGTLEDQHAPGDPFLPVKIQGVQVFKKPLSAARLVARVLRHPSPSEDSLHGDIQIVDEQGNLFIQLEGLEMVRFRSASPAPDDLLYRLEWIASPAQPHVETQPADWLVASLDSAAAQRLAGLLKPQAASVTLHQNGAKLSTNSAEIIYLAVPDNQAPSTAAETHVAALLDLIQAMGQVEWSTPPRLWLVTQGAHHVVEGDPINPALAALWGMAASAAHEYPAWRVTRIDTPVLDSILLLNELLNGAVDPVALRGEQRFIARLTPEKIIAATPRPTPAKGRSFRIEIAEPGVLDSLTYRATPRQQPAPGQVEIEVGSAALNFIDVMKSLGIYPGADPHAQPVLGLECAGTVTALGDDVSGLQIGQSVIAFARRSFATHVLADARLVWPIPSGLFEEEAAALPVVYLTCYYALVYLGRIQPGERVLIHSAAGGVGLAAIQLANHYGAEIFATAGSETKRSFLRDRGVQHVFDSRSLDFADEIMRITAGHGVDLVLNSLTGEAIPRSLAILAPYGRFLEIGKRDIYQNSAIGLFPFQKNLSYYAIDLDRMATERPALLDEMMRTLLALIEASKLEPMPALTVFPVSHAVEAFRRISETDHTGKIIINMSDADVDILPAHEELAHVKPDATYLITGGLGGLGLATAQKLVAEGARHLVLVGRSGEEHMDDTSRQSLLALRELGVQVIVQTVDVARLDQVTRLFEHIRANMPPLCGVIHAAGLLDDGIVEQQNIQRLRAVFAPKIAGAWNLHCLTENLPLDFFILYSSVAAPFGSPAQSNYAAANAFLDGLAHYRRSSGLPALSINWGPWGQIGLAAQRQQGGTQGLGGLKVVSPQEFLDVFSRLLGYDGAQIIAARLDAAAWLDAHPAAARSTLFEDLVAQGTAASAHAADNSMRAKLQAASPGRPRRALLESFIQEQAATVLRLPPARVDLQKPLRSMGMDSLMGIEFRNRLENSLALALSATLIWNYPTVHDLAPFLAEKMSISLDQNETDTSTPVESSHPSAPPSDLDGVSDEDLSAMLDEALKDLDNLL